MVPTFTSATAMKPERKTNFMYHISRHYLGQKAVFTPRVPVSQNKCEIDLPARVCAAPTIEQCWEAINGCHDLIDAMKGNNVTGYYFFVYKFNDSASFSRSTSVKDFSQSGEMISLVTVEAELIDVFYVDCWRLRRSLHEVTLKDGSTLKGAKEHATIEEAIAAYNEWQGEDLRKIEKKIHETPWP